MRQTILVISRESSKTWLVQVCCVPLAIVKTWFNLTMLCTPIFKRNFLVTIFTNDPGSKMTENENPNKEPITRQAPPSAKRVSGQILGRSRVTLIA